jgi:hypothetical protein
VPACTILPAGVRIDGERIISGDVKMSSTLLSQSLSEGCMARLVHTASSFSESMKLGVVSVPARLKLWLK